MLLATLFLDNSNAAEVSGLYFVLMAEGVSTDEVVPLVENEDYYIDRGLMVFTARYHLRRGYCCERGCRHCPYDEAPKRDEDRNVDSNEETK